jgi:hypothetical protein
MRFAVSIGLLGWAGAAAAQTAALEPWTRVPAAPTSYYSDDNFVDKVSGVSVAWKYVAVKKETFAYECSFHPNMQGKLIVE